MLTLLRVLMLATSAASLMVMSPPSLRSAYSSVVPSSCAATRTAMVLGGAGKSFRGIVQRIRVRPVKLGPPGGDSGVGSGDGSGNGGDSTGSTPDAEDSGDDVFPLVKLWKQYEVLLDEKPLLMKALTSLTGFAIGDILAQIFIQKQEFDWFRLFRLASFGFLVHGTTSHWFYGKLDGAIPGKGAGPVATKVFIDQVLWNPIFGVMFFSYVACLEAKGIGYVIDKTKNELFTQVTGSWKVWPLAHTINFRFIPSSQRVLYINTIQIFYNCFLSLISNR